MGPGPTQQDGELPARQEHPEPLGQRPRAWRGLVELAVEVVKEPADGLGVVDFREADGQVRAAPLQRGSPGWFTKGPYSPSCLPRISFMISSVPPPIGPRRASRTARSIPYSRM